MKCYIDIENSKTQKVETLCVNIIKYEEDKEAIFDISTLNSHELEILKDAINDDLTYTDIEMFFIGESNIPNFGPDYKCNIVENTLVLDYIPKKRKMKVEEKNEDWTLQYENEFEKLAFEFMKSDSQYLLIYRENENLKSEFIKSKPKKSIFMDLFFDKNYNMIALFKKKSNVNSTNLRDHLEYIDSYCEDENLEEGRHL